MIEARHCSQSGLVLGSRHRADIATEPALGDTRGSAPFAPNRCGLQRFSLLLLEADRKEIGHKDSWTDC